MVVKLNCCYCGAPVSIYEQCTCPGAQLWAARQQIMTLQAKRDALPTAPQVITALLEALERADILLDQLDRDIDVVACLCQMNEAKRMAEDWENRE